ncbi:MAG: biotin--[acetyl-CoA-carboxylase] ligase [Gemmatimonadaceae bacterium]|nr:biotin--[acetyl-CoA-carboxylase] ligase [Gemmatimonadaceae bacterium]
MRDGHTFDGIRAEQLSALLVLPRVEVFAETTSTLDMAHRLGDAGAPAGTLVIADHQTAGRGRSGRRWSSTAASGLWLTLLERPRAQSGVGVLSLRVGLRSARALDRFVSEPIRVKWPNDLYVNGRKLAGILIEARWREARLEWVAIGLGVNTATPGDIPDAGSLDTGVQRVDVLVDLIPGLRAAAACEGELTSGELAEWDARDLARGRQCIEPARGRVAGITASGELLVALADSVATFRSGSLVLDRLMIPFQ